MNKLFRGLDRNSAIGLLVGILVTVILQFVWVAPAEVSRDEALEQQAVASAQLDVLSRRVAEIQRDGTGSIDALVDKVRRLESTLPAQIDDLAVAGYVSRQASTSGVVLQSFSPADQDAKAAKQDVQGTDLVWVPYTFQVQGSSTAVSVWLDTMLRSTEYVVVVRDVSASAKGSSDPAVLETELVLTGTLDVLISKLPPLLVKSSDEEEPEPVVVPTAPATDPAAGPSGAPVTPSGAPAPAAP